MAMDEKMDKSLDSLFKKLKEKYPELGEDPISMEIESMIMIKPEDESMMEDEAMSFDPDEEDIEMDKVMPGDEEEEMKKGANRDEEIKAFVAKSKRKKKYPDEEDEEDSMPFMMA